MDYASKLIQTVFGKNISGGYAILFLLFVLICILFVAWAIYYATKGQAAEELQNITWLGFRDTVKYTLITLISIIVTSLILFVYDFGLDKLANLIVNNAK